MIDEKTRATFYLDEDTQHIITAIFIKRILKDKSKRVTRSAIVTEALRLLLKREQQIDKS